MRLLYDARHAGRGLGISTFVVELARALVAAGEVQLIWLGDPVLAPPGAVSHIPIQRRPYPLLDGPLGRALTLRTGPDLIHFTGNTGWRRSGPVPTVLTLHDLIFLDSGARHRSLRQVAGHRYERWSVPHATVAADQLIVPSHTIADEVAARLPSGPEPRVIYEGVSAPSQGDTSTGMSRTVAPKAPYIVAFAGRDPRKHTSDVVQAWRELASSPLRLHLLAAGGLPAGLRESLATEIASGSVEIHPHQPREQLWTLLQGALALVYCSDAEGFGLPVLEGMAAGTPVLAGIAPVTREIGGGAIVQLDPGAIAGSIVQAVRHLLASPADVASIVERGRQRAAAFTWQATAAGYLSAYREAIAHRR
jgi:glycosyltransferase involved in cell wall biosynthesis